MKNPYEVYETDSSAEIDGVWQELDGWRILLARSGSKNTLWDKELDKEVKKLGKATISAVSPEAANKIVMKVFSKVCVKAHEILNEDTGKWKSGVFIRDDSGVKLVPFNPKNMCTCLKQLPDYYDDLRKWADDFTTFQAEVEKETIKK